MKALRAIVDFVTGGSLAAPIGLALAIVAAAVLPGPSAMRATIFLAIVVASFAVSTIESPT